MRSREIQKDDDGVLISIVIPVFNHVELTRECIENLRRHTQVSHDIIVVNNGSTDATASYLQSEQIHAIKNSENLGFPRAANQGIESARGRYICLLNNDVTVLEGWLEPLLESLVNDPGIGIVGPKQVSPRSTVWHAGTAFGPDDHTTLARKPFHIFIDYPDDDPLVNVGRCYPAMNFGCCLIPARMFDEIGLLDDDTFLFPGLFEDVDWCLRLRKGGYQCLYCPNSKVIHLANQTQYKTGESLKKKSLAALETNLERLIKKWQGEPESFLVPDYMRPILDDYFSSAPFLREEKGELRRQVSDLRGHNQELEADWKLKCEQIEAMQARIAELEAGSHQTNGSQPKRFWGRRKQ